MTRQPSITAAIIALNEEQKLPGLLQRLDWVDEIVVVDGGSTDATFQHRPAARLPRRDAASWTASPGSGISPSNWPRGDWVLSIDADERPTPPLDRRDPRPHRRVPARRPFGCRFAAPFSGAGCAARARRTIARCGCSAAASARWVGDVHEVLAVAGRVGRLQHWLEHETLPDLPALLAKIERYTTLEAAARVAAGRGPAWHAPWLAPPREVFRRLFWKQGLLDGPAGWAFCLLSGCRSGCSRASIAGSGRKHSHLRQKMRRGGMPKSACWVGTYCAATTCLPAARGRTRCEVLCEHLGNSHAGSPTAATAAGARQCPPGLRLALAQEGIPCQDRAAGMPEGRFVLVRFAPGALPRCGSRPGRDRRRSAPRRLAHRSLRGLDERRRPPSTVGIRRAATSPRSSRRSTNACSASSSWISLRAEIELSGGVWLRVAAYPFPYRSALNFRIDYDEYHPQHFQATMAAIAGSEACTSHYVNGSAYRRASRGHRAAPRARRGKPRLLAPHLSLVRGEPPQPPPRRRSAARRRGSSRRDSSPRTGVSTPSLLSAMERLGITHSSEFALAYDELPFYPGRSRVLQVPIHPVCFEIMLEGLCRGAAVRPLCRRDARTQGSIACTRLAVEYFREVARTKYASGDPLFFYGHPTGTKGPSTAVVRSVLAMAGDFAALWKTTLSELAAWWQIRSGVVFMVFRDGDELVVDSDPRRPRPPHRPGILAGPADGADAAEGRAAPLFPSALAYEVRSGSPGMRPVRAERPAGWRAHLRQLIDWERVTPVEEIVPNNWRNLAKRTLRLLS